MEAQQGSLHADLLGASKGAEHPPKENEVLKYGQTELSITRPAPRSPPPAPHVPHTRYPGLNVSLSPY